MLLAVALLDELVFGLREAAWPLIRDDLSLSYGQIGLLLALPQLFSAVVEPVIGVMGDASRRRALVLGGGLVYAVALAAMAASPGFAVLVAATLLLYPASGAFVGLSQASLMDLDASGHERGMVRWVVASGFGTVAGPMFLAGAVAAGAGWRLPTAAMGAVAAGLAIFAGRIRPAAPPGTRNGLRRGLRDAWSSLRSRSVARWLAILQVQDFGVELLFGFLALYLVDVVDAGPIVAGLAVAVWAGAGLIGEVILLALLRRVSGLRYLRVTAGVALGLTVALLALPGILTKLVLVALLGLCTSGWYSIPKGRLYSSLPGRSGTAMALSAAAGAAWAVVPVAVGALASAVGLGAALWVCLIGPIGVLVLTPRAERAAVPLNRRSPHEPSEGTGPRPSRTPPR